MPLLTSMHWGVYEVDTSESGTPKLKPFTGDPDPSPIGLHALSQDVQRMRVRRPAVRKSWLEHGPGAAPELRGREPFVEVEWDVALDLVAKEIDRVRRAHGNQAIFGGSYGWASAGRFHHAQSQVHRFLNSLGGYVRHTDSYSLGAGRVLMPHIFLGIDELFVSHTDWNTLEEHTELFVAFGGVPAKNAQVAAGGTSEHRIPGALRRMAERGTRFINISPVRDDLDTGAAIDWIPIRPNTDTALMLGIAHTLYVNNWHDQAFIERYCKGFERFAPYLVGQIDGQPKDAAWASAITGIGSDTIENLARAMATHRTMLNIAFALQRADHGEQPYWMIVTLAAMLGQLGLPGGGVGIGYGATNTIGSPHVRFKGPTLGQGDNAVSAFIPVARIADCLLNPGSTFQYNGKTHTYPEIRLVYWAGGNPFHHHQDLNRLLEAWQRPETIVVQEQFWTATAKLSDVVLPATTTLERDDLGYANRESHMIAMRQVTDRTGEARDDYDIFADIADRLGAREAFTENRTSRQWIEKMYEDSRSNAAAEGIEMPGFDNFWQQGVVEFAPNPKPVIMLEDFRRDPDAHPLKTPSGKIEVFSDVIAGFGYDDCGGHPAWHEPVEWLGSDKASEFPLHLLSDQPKTRLHSQLDPSPHSQAEKIQGRQPVTIHPEDAAARGIGDGDIVRLFNERGSCLAGAVVCDDIAAGVLRLSTGAWFDPDLEAALGGVERHGNPNVLTVDRGASQLSQGCIAQTCLVEVEPFGGELPAIAAHSPPRLI
ncbi:MAG: molybdopterin guanine dinucleotide-containing S/N-oxide reductase [Gammaproteobacteria bacterium]|nr:molybdopterin guanine dinucleotide-containing S/N-oxide reductase [Gammaproteobacteria bacterium]